MFIISLTYKVDIAQIEAHMDAHKNICRNSMMPVISSLPDVKFQERAGLFWRVQKVWRHWSRFWLQIHSICINWQTMKLPNSCRPWSVMNSAIYLASERVNSSGFAAGAAVYREN